MTHRPHQACKSKDLHPGLHRDRIALINVRELVETTEVDKTSSSSKVAPDPTAPSP